MFTGCEMFLSRKMGYLVIRIMWENVIYGSNVERIRRIDLDSGIYIGLDSNLESISFDGFL